MQNVLVYLSGRFSPSINDAIRDRVGELEMVLLLKLITTWTLSSTEMEECTARFCVVRDQGFGKDIAPLEVAMITFGQAIAKMIALDCYRGTSHHHAGGHPVTDIPPAYLAKYTAGLKARMLNTGGESSTIQGFSPKMPIIHV